jgi:hypothetical protein
MTKKITKGKPVTAADFQRYLDAIKNPVKNFIPDDLRKIAQEYGNKPVKKAMGGEVMDTTKSMPVGMMDGGKVKPMKMKMGGVIPGRGGMFKGIK